MISLRIGVRPRILRFLYIRSMGNFRIHTLLLLHGPMESSCLIKTYLWDRWTLGCLRLISALCYECQSEEIHPKIKIYQCYYRYSKVAKCLDTPVSDAHERIRAPSLCFVKLVKTCSSQPQTAQTCGWCEVFNMLLFW